MLRNRNKIGDPDHAREEAYRSLFPKIGRDFVTREDLEAFIESLIAVLYRHNIQVDGLNDLYAKQLAEKYKDSLDGGVFETYKDLINLDE